MKLRTSYFYPSCSSVNYESSCSGEQGPYFTCDDPEFHIEKFPYGCLENGDLTTTSTQHFDLSQNLTSTGNSELSDEKIALCKDIVRDATVDPDSGIVTFDDGSTQTCDYEIDQQAMGAIFYWDDAAGDFKEDKALTERAKNLQ